jgi:hypothetical protein
METLTENFAADQKDAEQYKHIKGWGIDADPKNNPTYPMKHYTGADHNRLNYPKASQQPPSVEVFHSNERPALTRVFGTSAPPTGLSGKIRRYAFRFSENSPAHWFALIFADRVNVVEGIVDDLKQGYIPNVFVERGWRAEWKYNRKATVKKLVVGAAITSAVVALIVMRNRNKRITSI